MNKKSKIDIDYITRNPNDDNLKLLQEFLQSDGCLYPINWEKYSHNWIIYLTKNINNHNLELLQALLQIQSPDKKYLTKIQWGIYSDKFIKHAMEFPSTENLDLMQQLLKIKSNDQIPLYLIKIQWEKYSHNWIIYLTKNINNHNLELLQALLQIQSPDKEYLTKIRWGKYSDQFIKNTIESPSTENLDLLQQLLKIKSNYDIPLINIRWGEYSDQFIKNTIESPSTENLDLLQQLLKIKSNYDIPLINIRWGEYSDQFIKNTIESPSTENLDLLQQLLKIKSNYDIPLINIRWGEYSDQFIKNTIESPSTENLDLLQQLIVTLCQTRSPDKKYLTKIRWGEYSDQFIKNTIESPSTENLDLLQQLLKIKSNYDIPLINIRWGEYSDQFIKNTIESPSTENLDLLQQLIVTLCQTRSPDKKYLTKIRWGEYSDQFIKNTIESPSTENLDLLQQLIVTLCQTRSPDKKYLTKIRWGEYSDQFIKNTVESPSTENLDLLQQLIVTLCQTRSPDKKYLTKIRWGEYSDQFVYNITNQLNIVELKYLKWLLDIKSEDGVPLINLKRTEYSNQFVYDILTNPSQCDSIWFTDILTNPSECHYISQYSNAWVKHTINCSTACVHLMLDILQIKANDGKPLIKIKAGGEYSDQFVRDVFKFPNRENLDLLQQLLKIKLHDGKPLIKIKTGREYSDQFVKDVIKHPDKEKIDLLQQLLKIKSHDGKPLIKIKTGREYSDQFVEDVVAAPTKEKIDLLQQLLKIKLNYDIPLINIRWGEYSDQFVKDVVAAPTKEKIDLLQQLLKIKSNYDIPLINIRWGEYSNQFVKDVVAAPTKEKVDLLQQLLIIKLNAGKPLINLMDEVQYNMTFVTALNFYNNATYSEHQYCEFYLCTLVNQNKSIINIQLYNPKAQEYLKTFLIVQTDEKQALQFSNEIGVTSNFFYMQKIISLCFNQATISLALKCLFYKQQGIDFKFIIDTNNQNNPRVQSDDLSQQLTTLLFTPQPQQTFNEHLQSGNCNTNNLNPQHIDNSVLLPLIIDTSYTNNSTNHFSPQHIGGNAFLDLLADKFYIDKTNLIREIGECGHDTILITCPRRFGKSINMQMIKIFFTDTKYFYSSSKDKYLHKQFEEMGKKKKLDIFAVKNQGFVDEHCAKHPVIYLDLQNLIGTSYAELEASFMKMISTLFTYHGYVLDELDKMQQMVTSIHEQGIIAGYKECFQTYRQSKSKERCELIYAVNFLSEMLFKIHKKKVYILIDEYDAPIQNILASQGTDKDIEAFHSFIDDFLKITFKHNEHNSFGMLTGISGIVRATSASKFNISKHYQFLNAENHMQKYYGITNKDLDNLLSKIPDTKLTKLNILTLKSLIKGYYNGYKDMNVADQDNSIYNTWSVINFISDFIKNQNTTFKHYWSSTGKIDFISNTFIHKDIKETISNLVNGQIVYFTLHNDLSLNELNILRNFQSKQLFYNAYNNNQDPIDQDTIKTLFFSYIFELGYLSVFSEGEYIIPNKEVQKDITRYIVPHLHQKVFIISIQETCSKFDEFMENTTVVSQNKFKIALTNLFGKLNLSPTDAVQPGIYPNEDLFHSILNILVIQSKAWKFITECTISSTGKRADIIFMFMNKCNALVGGIIEVKCIASSNAQSALSQIYDKKYYKFFESVSYEIVKKIINIGINVEVSTDTYKLKEVHIEYKVHSNYYGSMNIKSIEHNIKDIENIKLILSVEELKNFLSLNKDKNYLNIVGINSNQCDNHAVLLCKSNNIILIIDPLNEKSKFRSSIENIQQVICTTVKQSSDIIYSGLQQCDSGICSDISLILAKNIKDKLENIASIQDIHKIINNLTVEIYGKESHEIQEDIRGISDTSILGEVQQFQMEA